MPDETNLLLLLDIIVSDAIGSASFLNKSHMWITDLSSRMKIMYDEFLDHTSFLIPAPLVNESHVTRGDSV